MKRAGFGQSSTSGRHFYVGNECPKTGFRGHDRVRWEHIIKTPGGRSMGGKGVPMGVHVLLWLCQQKKATNQIRDEMFPLVEIERRTNAHVIFHLIVLIYSH